jgi:hypothetical protein
LQHLLKRFLLRVCSSLLIESEALLHSNSQRAMIFERLKPFTPFHNLRGKPKTLSISLSLLLSACPSLWFYQRRLLWIAEVGCFTKRKL